eukprot:366071-Chlamydomonas_euryale.AAC.11
MCIWHTTPSPLLPTSCLPTRERALRGCPQAKYLGLKRGSRKDIADRAEAELRTARALAVDARFEVVRKMTEVRWGRRCGVSELWRSGGVEHVKRDALAEMKCSEDSVGSPSDAVCVEKTELAFVVAGGR